MTHKILFAIAILFSSTLLALPTDKDQPLEINSESAELREQEGYAIYTNDVRMVQGSLQIDADRVEIFFPDKKVTKALIYGDGEKRAYFQQIPNLGDKPVKGTAKRIVYQVDPDEIRLLGDDIRGEAIFCQKGSEQKGKRIIYDIENDVMRAKARVQSIFRPDSAPGNCDHIHSDYRQPPAP